MTYSVGDEQPSIGGGFIQAEEGKPTRTIICLDIPNINEYMTKKEGHERNRLMRAQTAGF